MGIQICRLLLSWLLPAALLGVATPPAARAQAPHAYHLSGDYPLTHDPSIIKEGNTWYVFATGHGAGGELPIRCSEDLRHWKNCGTVFPSIPGWIRRESPKTRALWAPDVSYFNGLYHIYYAFSVFGKNTSGIALVTNRTLDRTSPNYRWVDRGLVLRSVESDNFNAIDPNLSFDAQGHAWLAFGSFWSGIKMRRIDPRTGLLSKKDPHTYSLATRTRPAVAAPAPPGLPANWEAIEAPFVVHHGGYYYLFVSWDLCCRGVKSTYHVMVGRSRHITGPYLDAKGVPMMKGGGTEILKANHLWVGPGGESVLVGKPRDIIVFHAYDAKTGVPALQVSTLTWGGGWPHATMLGDGK